MMNATQSTAAIDQPAAGLSQELLDECRQLALVVAPELSRDPLYFENAPADYPRTPTMIALAVDSRDFRTRQMLIDAGRYEGPGRAVLFFDGTLDRISALGVALHETGH